MLAGVRSQEAEHILNEPVLQHINCFVMGMFEHDPKMQMTSFTTLRATMRLSASEPLSFVNKALPTEKPLSGAALPRDRVSAALQTQLKC